MGALLLAALLSACSIIGNKAPSAGTGAAASTSGQNLLDFSDTRYIVTLSQTFEDKALLVCIGKDGAVSKTIPYDGQAINGLNRLGDDLYLHSERVNRHFILKDQREWQEFSYAKNEIKDSEYAGSWLTANGEQGLIQTMNIGLQDDGYHSAILYQEQGEERVVHLKNLSPESVVDYGGKIYVNAYYECRDDDNKEYKTLIYVIDRKTGACTAAEFPHAFTAYSGDLVRVNDKLVTYGSNEAMLHVCEDKTVYCMLGVLDSKTMETKELDCSDDGIVLLYEHQGQIYTLTKSGKLKVYTDDLSLVETKKLEDFDFLGKRQSDGFYLMKVIPHGDRLAMLFINADLDPKDAGIIQEYSKEDLKPLQTSKLLLPDCEEWMGELSDFIVVE